MDMGFGGTYGKQHIGRLIKTSGALTIALAVFFTAIHTSIAKPKSSTVEPMPHGNPVVGSKLPVFVPFDLWNGLIALRATIGTNTPQIALLTTSLPVNLINTTIAVNFKIPSVGETSLPVMDQIIKAPATGTQTVHIGDLTVEKAPFAIFNLIDYLEAKSNTDTPGLWLSLSTLGVNMVTIDPVAHMVIFHAPTDPLPAHAMIIPFQWKDGRIWVKANVDGKKTFEAVLDLGTTGILLPTIAAAPLRLKPLEISDVVDTSGRSYQMISVQMSKLEIGKSKLENLPAYYVIGEKKGGFDPKFGIIGADYLLHFRATIDFSKHEIALEPYGLGNAPQAPATSPQPQKRDFPHHHSK